MDSNNALLAGALDHLMRHALTGCAKAAHQASRLLDVLSERSDVDSGTRVLCGRMSEKLEAGLGGRHV
ncbi:MAG: hypothetical protein H6935_05345 [Thiobacillus sp.]|nr:hypothetical protein [Thiobacillus sp.]